MRNRNRILTCLVGTFAAFAAAGQAPEASIDVHAGQILHPVSRYLTGACIEDVNHEVYGGIYSQMIFGESFQEPPPPVPTNGPATEPTGVSGEWRALRRGSAKGRFSVERQSPFTGRQSQRVTFAAGEGEVGIENQGLNRWGMYLVEGKPYQGHLWVRVAQPMEFFAALESGDGQTVLAEQKLVADGDRWQKLDFTLTPSATVTHGQFAIKLKQPGAITVGYVFLQPGPWGLFKGLPDRKDVAEGLIDQGVTVLRYGGSMVNAGEYRWKHMIGPRDHRPPYRGAWYRYSTDGWGILDFLNFCEAAGFMGIPAFNINETPRDMADFVEYVNGPADSEWGRKRVADGHPAPYHLSHMELGNEERVDENYWNKFKPMAEAIWAKDPNLIPVVGDFAYSPHITDPFHFKAASGITSLAAQQKILQLAKEHQAEVWFDVHVGTDRLPPDDSLAGMFAYDDALAGLADGARYHVAVFEFNAGHHNVRRALANALAINAIERDGRIPVATSANCLQPDGQNNNGWNQGLLFLNPSQVWLQPPGYVTRMISRNYEPLLVKSEVQSPGHALDVSAERSEDGKTLVLQVVNAGDQETPAAIHLDGWTPSNPVAEVEELAGPLDAVNTAEAPTRVQSNSKEWRYEFKEGGATYDFPAHSFTVIRFGPAN